MKLLAELQTEDVDEPRQRPVAAILGGVVVLVLMFGAGVTLLLAGDDPGGGDSAGAVQDAPPATDTVDLASWIAGAGDACGVALGAHPVLADPGAAAPVEVEAGVRALADGLRDVPLPTERDARAEALRVITVGELAEQTWGGIAATDRADADEAALANADERTQEFIGELGRISAACAVLG